ncbi:MAG TPA: hypothetical protein PLJ12_02770, partial [Planctomycetota bacterium]|nr:hypothetical protein [Planctomycetota bacterium]
PYPDRPAVLREYLGDQVEATGVSSGDILATSQHSTLRVSIGFYSDWYRRDNPLDPLDPGRPELEWRDQPRLDELAVGARVSGVVDVGAEGMFQWGLSAQGLPDYGLQATADDGTELRLENQSQWLYGLDLTFGHADETEGPAWSLGWQGILASGDGGGQVSPGPSPVLSTFEGDLFGHYAWVERRTRSGRALGLIVSQHERPLAGKPLATEASVYFSRPLVENALLRFAVRHRDAEGEPDGQAILVQFVALAGSLGHALDW